MDTQVGKRVLVLVLAAITLWIFLCFSHPLDVSAEPLPAPAPVDIPPCTLPGSMTGTPPDTGPFSIHPGEPAPNLVITCLRFDRSHYQVGDTWQASMTVQNVGTASVGGMIDVEYQLCRWNEDGDYFACHSPTSAAVMPDMGPGTAQLLQFNGDFLELPEDQAQGYESWRDGIPNNVQVVLRVFLRQAGVTIGSALTETVYPSGPDTQVAGDQDGDGWAPPADCDDFNPNMHPFANEIVGNYDDDDCAGGDLSPGNYGCDDPVEVVYTLGNPPYSPCQGPPGFTDHDVTDYDGDTWEAVVPGQTVPAWYVATAQLGDCDDFNPAVYPGAPELLSDGLDNNCNGLIDEGSVTPDWLIFTFVLDRDYEDYAYEGIPFLLLPGLRYEIGLTNVGDDLGDDTSAIPVNIIDPDHGIVASGTSGFLFYNWLPDAAEYACSDSELVAEVPDIGLFYEVNTSNNQSIAPLPEIGPTDRALQFSDDPSFLYTAGGTDIGIVTNGESLGTCPPLPIIGGYPNTLVSWEMTVNGEVVFSNTLSGVNYLPSVDLAQPLANHDIVCLEITLDPHYFVIEDHDNNMFVGVFEYRVPFIGQSRFDEVDTAYGRAGATWTFPGDLCGEIGTSTGALTTGGGTSPAAWIGMILVSLVGGGIGFLGSRRLTLGRVGLILLTAGGLVVGGLGGWVAGEALARNRTLSQAAIVLETMEGEPSLIPTCDLYLDSNSAVPSEGATFEYTVETLPLSISILEELQPSPSVLEIIVTSPSGTEAILPVSIAQDGSTFQLDLISALIQQGSDLLFEEGDFSWSIALGYVDPGGDVLPLQPLCQGSSDHVFTILPAPTAAPTDTPTEQPTMEPATVVPDTQGPTVSGVGDSPDPVFTNGNPPDTATVLATITDPSGVASVTLYYSDGGKTTYQVWGPMSGSGDSYSTAFGPFGSAGTYEYRIYAVDDLGNTNCSTSNIDACPGGTLTVIIP